MESGPIDVTCETRPELDAMSHFEHELRTIPQHVADAGFDQKCPSWISGKAEFACAG